MAANRLLVMLGLFLLSACQQEQADRPGVTGLRLDNILGEEDSAGFTRADRPRSFEFPRDHGAHPRYRSEWWYLTTVLEDPNGRAFGVHFTLFRQALTPEPTGEGPWHTGQAWLGHLAVTDINDGTHREAERFARGHPALAGVETRSGFRALIEDWTLEGSVEPTLNLTLTAGQADDFSVTLHLRQTAPVVLQGERGWSEKGPGSASYYYSMPRLEVSGTIELDGQVNKIKGLGWLDREWSTSVLGEALSGWDWFSIQLDDQRSIMAFRLRRHDGERDPFDHGLIVDHSALERRAVVGSGDRGIRLLTPSDFLLKPTRYYRDHRGIQWPVSWELEVQDETFIVHAMLDAQTVDLSIVYWEGLIEVQDTQGQRLGRGYMELTGYGSASGDSAGEG